MKAISLFLLCNAMWMLSYAQLPNLDWAISTEGSKRSVGEAVTTLESGSVYVCGSFRDSVDFDPGTGQAILKAVDLWDIYIQKLDPQGNLIWAKSFGELQLDQAHDMTHDKSGNIYITGRFTQTIDFDPGPGFYTRASHGSHDGFVLKLDSNGIFQWAQVIGSTGADEVYSVAVDTFENVFITGFFEGTVDFDPGTGTQLLTSNGTNDIFIQKLDKSGNLLWAKSMGGIYGDAGRYLTTDIAGNVYVTGVFMTTVDFDPGSGVFNLYAPGSYQTFVLKLDPAGNFVWAKSVGATLTVSQGIAVDPYGDVIITGSFQVPGDFDPGPAIYTLNNQGTADIYVLKLSSNGQFVWAQSIGGRSWDATTAVDTDQKGNLYIVGSFSDSVDFDPGIGVYKQGALGSYDLFLLQLDSGGLFQWASSFGGVSDEISYSIEVDQRKNIYTTGFYSQTTDFAPDSFVHQLTAQGLNEAFVQKLSQCSTSGIDSVVACDSTTWIDGKTYYVSSQLPRHTLLNAAGCDSLVQLDLQINHSSTATDQLSTCDSLTWIDGNTYAANNQSATHILINSEGCDSVITLDLTINRSDVIDAVQACDSLTWIDGTTYTTSNTSATHLLTNTKGCDSLVTLNLNLGQSSSALDLITACKSHTWINGQTYTESQWGVRHTLINGSGCDSVVSLDLRIKNISGMEVNQQDSVMYSAATNASYQWLKCDEDFQVIEGEANASFRATENGEYAVQVSQNGCTDTSVCVGIDYFITPVYRDFSCTSMYPNPSQGDVTLELGENKKANLKVYSLNGRLMTSLEDISGPLYNLFLPVPDAIYLVEVEIDGVRHHCKLDINK